MAEIDMIELEKQANVIKNQAEKLRIACNTIREELAEINSIIYKRGDSLSKNVSEYLAIYNSKTKEIIERYINLSEVMKNWSYDSEEYERMTANEINRLSDKSIRIREMIEKVEQNNN